MRVLLPETYLLAGATATGKSAVAARLAREMGAAILSADSMLVYRGMDVGTAKPPRAEIEEFSMGGVDLVTPAEEFSAGAWLRAAVAWARALPPGRPVVVVGGTGLYFTALLRGIDRAWTKPPPAYPVLAMNRERRRARIAARLDAMFAAGLEDEVRALRARYPAWSRTASGAIGYKEFLDPPVDGRTVKEVLFARTCQYAKRQDTWFRHQATPLYADADAPEGAVEAVRAVWRARGPWSLELSVAESDRASGKGGGESWKNG